MARPQCDTLLVRTNINCEMYTNPNRDGKHQRNAKEQKWYYLVPAKTH